MCGIELLGTDGAGRAAEGTERCVADTRGVASIGALHILRERGWTSAPAASTTESLSTVQKRLENLQRRLKKPTHMLASAAVGQDGKQQLQ